MAITRVAVAGGTGNLRPAIIAQLLEAGFQVTVLSRSSSHQVDSRAQIQVVDYNSLDSLATALKDHDALINTLNVDTVPQSVHIQLIEAAQAAGVSAIYTIRVAVIQKLQKTSKQDNSFSWTAVINGPFFDWGLEYNFLINLKGPSTPIYDGGGVPVSSTALAGIGRALVGVLRHLKETKNRHVFVAEVEYTQNQLLKLLGNGDKIKREAINTDDLEQQAYAALKQSPPDGIAFATKLILRAVYGGKFGSLFTKTDNELLGIRKLSESEFADLVKKYAYTDRYYTGE
ncbi:oxidoreductase CipA [Penicillium canescens]|nr:oxidoreductase CipA [Penicillium canescens]